MKKVSSYIVIFTIILTSCSNSTENKVKDSSSNQVIVDEYYTDLFMGECGGFTGGDGTYSLLLPDGRTLWIFGDTFIGGVNPDNTREKQDPKFIRNSVVIQDKDSLRTLFNEINGKNASFAIPPIKDLDGNEIPEDSIWFWPGDGYLEDGKLKIFYSEFAQIDTGMWGFKWLGTWLGSYSLPDIQEEEIIKIYDATVSHVHFGHAVHVDELYTYIYGAGKGRPHVARYANGDADKAWEYYTGNDWSADPSKSKPMAQIDGSEQFSIFRYDDLYILITQLGMLSQDICAYSSPTPYGPWGDKQFLYRTPMLDSTKNLLTYNALAHPQIIKNDMMLISYNTNSHELQDHYMNASIYRPRFVWVPMELIDQSFKN